MGKKSKRKSNKSSPCYHGCTKQEFNNCGEHYKVLEGWDDDKVDMDEFVITNQRVMEDPKFGRFAIAHIADDCLKGKDDDILRSRLGLLVYIRYDLIPRQEGKNIGPESEITKKYDKYIRDIQTERGRINCMAREIPCDCMEEKRIAAKSMDKVAMCWCCTQAFPKEMILKCKGCNHIQYCSKECSIEDWPRHKEFCRKGSSLATAPTSASAPTPTPASVPSSFTEPSDVGAEN